VFVDSLADLNIYLMAADAGPVPASCCGSNPINAETSGETADIDLNQWAGTVIFFSTPIYCPEAAIILASYQIYAMKPNNLEEEICATPLAKWWDAFPAVQTTNIALISPSELAAMLRDNNASRQQMLRDNTARGTSVIDVQAGDYDVRPVLCSSAAICSMDIYFHFFQRNHVKGSHHFAAQTFHNQLPAFHEQFSATDAVVFYCGSSVGRAPRCAGWYGSLSPHGYIIYASETFST
jgi:hypothetical protein